jgi:hypothetical protein
MIIDGQRTDDVPTVRLENNVLQIDVAPAVGGRVVSVLYKPQSYQFLWRNSRLRLRRCEPGSPYDPNFFGGIDELVPGDMPEEINSLPNPDHGELWTAALDYGIEDCELVLRGQLPICGLRYERRLYLRPDTPYLDIDYRLSNPTPERRVFLWKLHAALQIAPGDRIICPARSARVVDPRWSHWRTSEPFAWPTVEGMRADVAPPVDGTTDFLYLYDLQVGSMAWVSRDGALTFAYRFDQQVFPYAWYFASYGGMNGHYTAVLEPCTSMPISVKEAARLGQCSALAPGQVLQTRVTLYAGPAERSLSL